MFQGVKMHVRIVMIVGIEIKERGKWDRDTLLHMKKYEASDLMLTLNVKNVQ